MIPNIAHRLRRLIAAESTSGLLLLIAALAAVLIANSPWHLWYEQLSATVIGPEFLHLDLAVSAWASDGLLAVFFFVVGLELKHELTTGSLRKLNAAGVPVLAAVGGMLVPAGIFIALMTAFGDQAGLQGWAIPTATDIAFALAVLAVFGRGLPQALRGFLLTLAVVDDLLAICIIALAYTSTINGLYLVAALATITVFGMAARTKRMHWWVLVPLGLLAWWFMHSSGVHATIAGVALGLTIPAATQPTEVTSRTSRIEAAFRPWSAGLVLPVFAFFAAGVSIGGDSSLGQTLTEPIFISVFTALVLGKLVGVLGTTWFVTRFTRLRLPDAVGLRDLIPIGFLTGIGFTVSLLIAGLSFPDSAHTAGAKLAVLLGSACSAILGAMALRWNARKLRSSDMNDDGVPDRFGKPTI